VQTTFIIGSESLAGSTLDLVWSNQSAKHILALPLLADKSTAPFPGQDDVQKQIATHQPDTIIFCGHAAESSWALKAQNDTLNCLQAEQDALKIWTNVAREIHARFVFLTSDAVFAGPWMFHDESSEHFDRSEVAQQILKQENLVRSHCPSALIIRSHIIGFSPEGNGWLETTLQQIENQHRVPRNSTAYATPILATDFAEYLQELLQQSISGLYHLSGAERVNPAQFVSRVADAFGYTIPVSTISTTEQTQSETSLNCAKLRKCLGTGTPMLHESIQKLYELKREGFDQQIRAAKSLMHGKVA